MSMDDDNIWDTPAHVTVAYDDVISEPPTVKEHPIVKKVTACTEKTYSIVLIGIYVVLHCVIGTILSFVWACFYGFSIFATVWMVQPFLRLFLMVFRCFKIPYTALTRCMCDPCYIAASLIFSNMRLHHHQGKIEGEMEIDRVRQKEDKDKVIINMQHQ